MGNNSNNKNSNEDTNNNLSNNNRENGNNNVNRNNDPNGNNVNRNNNPNNNNRNKNNNPNSNTGNKNNNPNNNNQNKRDKPHENDVKSNINNGDSKDSNSNNNHKKDYIIASNKEKEDKQPNKSSTSNNEEKKGEWYQIDRGNVATMPKRHVNEESRIKEDDNIITKLYKGIYPVSLDTLANISKFVEAIQVQEIKDLKIEDIFKVYSYLFNKIYEVNIGQDAKPRNELVTRVVNSIREFTKEKARSEKISEEELIKDKHDEELRGKIVKAITIRNKKQVGNVLQYIKYIDMWCQGISLSYNEIKQILDFIQWIPEEELYKQAYIEINNTKELKRAITETYESVEYQERLIKNRRSKRKVEKNITEDVSKDTLWSDKDTPINEKRIGTQEVTHSGQKELQKIVKEVKEVKDEQVTENTRERSEFYEEHNYPNNVAMNEVLSETLIKQCNLKIGNLEKQNSELISRNANLEKERDLVNAEFSECQGYMNQLKVNKNKLHMEIITIKKINADIQAEKESLQQTNETLTTMLEKGKTFELDAYKSKLKSKLQFEYQQYLDTKEIIQNGVSKDISADVIELLYELVGNMWKVLKDNDIGYGDK